MTLQKNPSNATTRKRKFQEQSENQASTTSSQTTNRQQMQIQTEFQILHIQLLYNKFNFHKL